MRTIQIHIRSQAGLYLNATGGWSTAAEHSRNFASATEAEQFAREHDLSGIELVIHREGLPPLRIPVRRLSRAGTDSPSASRSSLRPPRLRDKTG
jgi:hypothetical protein